MCQKLTLDVSEMKGGGGGVQVYLNEEVRLFPIVDNSDKVKLYQRFFFQACPNEGLRHFFPRGNNSDIYPTCEHIVSFVQACFLPGYVFSGEPCGP